MSKTRMTIDLTPELDERLTQLAAAVGVGKGDAVLEALRVLEALVEMRQQGFEFHKSKDGKIERLPIFVSETTETADA